MTAAGAPISPESARFVVLVAEDDRDFCDLLSHWLGGEYQLMFAHDGDEALTVAHRCVPDVALVDVMMPRLSGFGLEWAFTHHPRLSDMPVVFMTAYHVTANSLPGNRKVLRKPFRKAELDLQLAEFLKDKRASGKSKLPCTEKRRLQRADVELDAVLRGGGESLKGKVLSLSLLGAYFRTDNPLPIGSQWTLFVRRGEEEYELSAEVIHNMDHLGGPGVGLCLHDLGLDREREFLRLLVELLEGS